VQHLDDGANIEIVSRALQNALTETLHAEALLGVRADNNPMEAKEALQACGGSRQWRVGKKNFLFVKWSWELLMVCQYHTRSPLDHGTPHSRNAYD